IKDLGEERVAQIGNKGHHAAGALHPQVSRRVVHPVAGFSHRIHHRLTRRLGHQIGLRQYATDGRGRHARYPRDIQQFDPAGRDDRFIHGQTLCATCGRDKKMFAIDCRAVQVGRREEVNMHTIKGPALFLAQFIGDDAPFDTWDGITRWASECGYVGVQVPTNDPRMLDLDRALESQDYRDEFLGTARQNGVGVTELSTHLQGQLVAVHPAYDAGFDAFAPDSVRGNPSARQEWAVDQVSKAIRVSRLLGLDRMATFSGALAWPYLYPWPQRAPGLIETAFDTLAARWSPLLDLAEDQGVDICYEIHPGEDLHDGVTFEMFLDRVGSHARANMLYDPSHYLLQQLDYLQNIDIYHDRIRMFHVKDAEFLPTGRQGVYGGYQSWAERAGRFRSPG